MEHNTPVESNMKYDNVQPKDRPINLSIILTMVIIGLIFVWSVYLFKVMITKEERQKEITNASLELTQLRAYEKEELNSVKWINKNENKVKLPINIAIKKTVQKYK